MSRPLIACVLLLVGCADREPPRWAGRAALEAQAHGAERIELRWPPAEDGVGVVSYAIRVDGRPGPSIEATASPAFVAEGLDSTHPHRFWVVAVDAEGNTSEPLEVEARTADELAPRFAEGATLTVELGPPGNSGERPVTLRWPPASDAVGVDDYTIFVDSEPAERTESRRASLLRALDGAEVFEVRARDAAGNESAGLFGLGDPGEAPEAEAWVAAESEGGPPFSVRLTEIRRVAGSREPPPVSRRLRARLRSAGGCYRRALESGPLFDGHLTLELEIRATGSVRAVNVVGAGLGRPALATCLRSVLLRAAFPSGSDGTFRARYEFAIGPSPG